MPDPHLELIGLIYRLYGSSRSLFAGPHANSGLVLLEALALAAIEVATEPPTVSDVARELGYLRQSVQRAVNKLIALGLVERQANRHHKSNPVYTLTAAGHSRMTIVRQPAHVLADHLRTVFSAERAVALVSEMAALNAAISAVGMLDDSKGQAVQIIAEPQPL